jgi:hypothetical protein
MIVAVETCSHEYSEEIKLSVNKVVETVIKYSFNI